ncbi:hypothetical protein [Mesorhizobium sp. 1B3]|uniref:hypothetical protein n=1 Tax=Mesorhizobium sp. 1B3 TaxID=3243599 RepID=UPI003D95722C
MLDTLRTAGLSAAIGFSALLAGPAHADKLYLDFGGPGVGVHVDDDHRDRRHRGDDDDLDDDDERWDRDDRWRRHDEYRRRCTPDQALWKAERMGVRRARVEDVSRRSITIRGRSHGDRVWVTFARAPGCPIIS